MRAGFGKKQYCCPPGLEMSGVGSGRIASCSLDPLFVRAVCIESGSNERVLLVSIDALYVGTNLTNRILAQTESRTGISPERVFLTATHTHSAPKTAENFLDGVAIDEHIFNDVEESALSAIQDSISSLQMASVSVFETFDIPTVNRRVPVPWYIKWHPRYRDKGTVNRPNRKVPSDTSARGLKFCLANKQNFWLLNCAMHTAVYRGDKYSGDFPAYIEQSLLRNEKKCLGMLFLQGWAGDQAADITNPAGHNRGFWSFVDRLAAQEEFSRKSELSDLIALGGQIAKLLNEKTPALSFTKVKSPVIETRLLSLPTDGVEFIQVTVKLLKIGPMRFIFLNGEPHAKFRLDLVSSDKSVSSTLITAGYLEGPAGYIPDREAIKFGGYEVDRSIHLFGQTKRFAPKAADMIFDTLSKLMV